MLQTTEQAENRYLLEATDANYLAASTTVNLTVSKAPIVFGHTSTIIKNFGDANFTITPPTTSATGAFSYTSSNPSVATITGNIVSIVGIGSATITATQASDAN